jgi:hypothetical protein
MASPCEIKFGEWEQKVKSQKEKVSSLLKVRFLPWKCSTEQIHQSLSRQDAKSAKTNISLFFRAWRPLRLGASSLLSDSLIVHAKKNAKYVWLVFGGIVVFQRS